MISQEDKELAEQEGWKLCPNTKCGKLVERIDGCNSMICPCGTNFCYGCGQEIKYGMPCGCNGEQPEWVAEAQDDINHANANQVGDWNNDNQAAARGWGHDEPVDLDQAHGHEQHWAAVEGGAIGW